MHKHAHEIYSLNKRNYFLRVPRQASNVIQKSSNMLQSMMTVGQNYSQNYWKFYLNQRVQVTHGTHRGCTWKLVGKTLK